MSSPTLTPVVERFRERAGVSPTADAVLYSTSSAPGIPPVYASLTYRELDDWSEAIAEYLRGQGVCAGTKAIVLVTPGPELYAVLLGLLKCGAVPVVIDPGMGVRAMVRCLSAVDAEVFVGVPAAQAVRVLFRRRFRRVRVNLTVGRVRLWGGPTLASLGREPNAAGPSVQPGATRAGEVAASDTALVAFTTGSTGPAKAVEITHGNLTAMVEQIDEMRGHVPPECSLVTLPLFGLLDLFLGTRCVLPPLMPARVGSTDPAHVADAITRFGVRTLFASPAVLLPLVEHVETSDEFEHRTRRFDSVRSIYSGGAPVPLDAVPRLRAILSADAEVYVGYGATEALPMAAVESRDLTTGVVERTRNGAGVLVGYPAPRVSVRTIRIVDGAVPEWTDGLEESGIGELVVSGPNVSTHYLWPETADAAAKIRDGEVLWHRTGDLARLDTEGRIWFQGRKSQRVETEHGPMFTVQVEQMFAAVDGVARTALVGVGGPGRAVPVLCVELQSGADPEQVRAGLRARADEFEHTRQIAHFLVHPSFPVDIRHNAKIGREELATWAARQRGPAGKGDRA
ncbi:AMP-binding protein [Rhodococcus triatomae]|uniref:Acyl-CoA synthetase (AMP-forming)/AMP-acid ligase II n=1 Tax=Rhodococcus triatomae TaxID=300028 RepID=A0A1G8L6N8_9NOCA|nr:fatty acid CoA ligase family protein [Rhodococcus triatomae]QNG20520.1 AMP-binding protein [Rhodococcus triatomae]QNG23562.1 AMP-binding protein [Rhodococcus triatomae]SDI51349.1 Acyl-CoA synthetase (AMP-forming)/AMP-acid ligase II [Rhodococcus triatomae]